LSLFNELKRRNVFKVSTAYVVVALAYFAYDKFVLGLARDAALIEAAWPVDPEQPWNTNTPAE